MLKGWKIRFRLYKRNVNGDLPYYKVLYCIENDYVPNSICNETASAPSIKKALTTTWAELKRGEL